MNPIAQYSRWLALGAGASALFCGAINTVAATNESVRLTEAADVVKVEIGNQLFTEYHFRDTPRPFLYPILGPGNAPMTRNWPMKDVPDEEHDHPHHKSLWFTHGDVNGLDFWTNGKDKGRIGHVQFLRRATENGVGLLQTSNHWVSASGKRILTDTRLMRFSRQDQSSIIDFFVTLYASEGEVKFGDTKEGSLGLRLAETMRLKGKVGHGHIVNSEGQRDGDTWGKRAAWCDYYGPVNGQTVGAAIFDHPGNPRFPTWWHVRDYGLFAANPFGIHDFEKKPAGTGDLIIPAGQSLTFRYRFYFHPGNETEAKVADHYQAFAAEKF